MFMFRNERSIAKDNDNGTLPVFICGFIITFAFQKIFKTFPIINVTQFFHVSTDFYLFIFSD